MIGLEVSIVAKRFPAAGGAPPRLVYRDFRLSVAPGAFVAILGPSGCGKTTLLNLIAGLDRGYEGEISLDGRPEPRSGYAFETPRLLPWRTVLENVLLPLPAGRQARERARALLAEMGLDAARDAYPSRLSLGMQRRAALARAFAVEPDLLLLDEPFVSLDEATAERLRDLLGALLARHPATVLFVTHDSREAVRLADRIVALAGAPARLVRDVDVRLTADERRSPDAVDGFRARLVSTNLDAGPVEARPE